MMGIARGISKWLANNQTVNPEQPLESINRLMDNSQSPLTFFPLPDGVWLALGLAVVMAVVLARRCLAGTFLPSAQTKTPPGCAASA
ncbi:MAG: hypothetical protein CM1200mP29_10480 [Verrucomicrobiota bacterium]|nr:MAG: hypothetical protein CM1200mP29_10480 [Verrucomicrobiota bacterium]